MGPSSFPGNSALYLFECYDTRTESWHTKPSMLTQRCSHGMVEANGLIYVCGGSLGNNVSGRVLNSCEVYDPATETYVWISNSVSQYCICKLSEKCVKKSPTEEFSSCIKNVHTVLNVYSLDPSPAP